MAYTYIKSVVKWEGGEGQGIRQGGSFVTRNYKAGKNKILHSRIRNLA